MLSSESAHCLDLAIDHAIGTSRHYLMPTDIIRAAASCDPMALRCVARKHGIELDDHAIESLTVAEGQPFVVLSPFFCLPVVRRITASLSTERRDVPIWKLLDVILQNDSGSVAELVKARTARSTLD